jgi:hypothetical protein
MFNPKPYRDKAAKYSERAKSADGPNETHRLEQLGKRFVALADNEQWLSDDHARAVQVTDAGIAAGSALANEEEHVLRCLGAALIMQWNTLPTKLQRELFDNASIMGELLDTASLRGQIARFLHKHKNGGPSVAKN